MQRIAIVGFGRAGFSALRAISASGRAEVHVYSDARRAPANPMLTTYYIAGKLDEAGMYPFGPAEELCGALDAHFHGGEAVTGLDGAARTLLFADGRTESFDGILIATGAVPFVPPLGGCPGGRVFCLRTPADAVAIKSALDGGGVSRALVVGSSMIGIKAAELLNDRGVGVTLADMAGHIFPLAALPDVAAEIERRITARGMSLRFGSAISSIAPEGRGIRAEFADGGALCADMAILCIGTRPNVGFLKGSGVAVSRGIPVDGLMRTNLPGIYAAGDCAEGGNLQTGKGALIGLWQNAAFQGETAGRALMGSGRAYDGNIPNNITHFCGMDFTGLGDVNAVGERRALGDIRGEWYIEAVTRGGRLLCVNLLGGLRSAGIIKNYILGALSGEREPLHPALRGLLQRDGLTADFLRLFEGGM